MVVALARRQSIDKSYACPIPISDHFILSSHSFLRRNGAVLPHFPFLLYEYTYSRINISRAGACRTNECVRLRCSSVLEHPLTYTTLHGPSHVCAHFVCVGLPRVNEYAAVAGWLVKTVALLAYPFLPPPPPSPSPWSSRYPLTRPPRDSPRLTLSATLNRRPPSPAAPTAAASSLVFLTFPIFHSRQARA